MNTLPALTTLRSWDPPPHWQRILTLDAHTGGEPLRVILSGFPDPPGDTMLARRRFLKDHHDNLRRAIMWEPRGHREMYGCLLTSPVTPGADFGVLFMHNEGFSTMCGHGIIAVATVAVRFQNVPSFVVALDETAEVPGVGIVRYDLAFGGAFYAYVDAGQLALQCIPEEIAHLVAKGMAIKHAVMSSREIRHPLEEDLGFLYGTIFIAPPLDSGADSRNVCVFANGEVDRSPTGTGVSGRMAIHFARQQVGLGQPYRVESIVGSRFTGRVVRTTTCGPYSAVIPEVEGRAYITGRQEFYLDPDDPFKAGFLL